LPTRRASRACRGTPRGSACSTWKRF
jgi:hypothetical protein